MRPSRVRIAVGADGFVLLLVEGTRQSPILHWWTSPDGLVWQELDQNRAVPSRSEVHALHLAGDGERLILVLEPGPLVWTSTDASTWMPGEVAFTWMPGEVGPPFTRARVEVGAVPTSFGWMMPGGVWVSGREPRCVVWVSADGVLWERIEGPAAPNMVRSSCHADGPRTAQGEWFGTDTVLAYTWGLGMWRGGFEE
jgi:hypothetical protein